MPPTELTPELAAEKERRKCLAICRKQLRYMQSVVTTDSHGAAYYSGVIDGITRCIDSLKTTTTTKKNKVKK